MKALVTGATGFIGRALVEELRRNGIDVRATVRRTSDLAPMAGEVVETGDLARFGEWDRAVAGIDVVFHVAGLAHLPSLSSNDIARLRATNVGATTSLVRASRAAGVRRFVFLSTAKVFGEESGARAWTEIDPAAPADEYARTKFDAENAIRELMEATSVILRPPLVYGPNVRANFLALLRAVDRRFPLPFEGIHNRRTMIFVRNLAHALRFAGESEELAGIFVVGDRESLSTADLVREIARTLGRSPRLFRVPSFAVKAAEALPFARSRIRKITGSLELDWSKIATSGWSPPYSLREGLEETAQWYSSSQR